MSDHPSIPAVQSGDSADEPEAEYEAPRLIDLGHTRDLAHGSSNSSNADANSQYYP